MKSEKRKRFDKLFQFFMVLCEKRMLFVFLNILIEFYLKQLIHAAQITNGVDLYLFTACNKAIHVQKSNGDLNRN